MTARLLGIAITVTIAACASDPINVGGHFHATWTIGSPAFVSCASVDVTAIRLTVIDGTGFQTLKEMPCEGSSGDSATFEAGSYTVLADALGAGGLAIKEDGPYTRAIQNQLATDVQFLFIFPPPATTGTISLFWTINGSVNMCPANAVVDTMLDGGSNKITPCLAGVAYTDVAPGAHTIDAQLADGSNTSSTTAQATVIAGMNTNVPLDFTFP